MGSSSVVDVVPSWESCACFHGWKFWKSIRLCNGSCILVQIQIRCIHLSTCTALSTDTSRSTAEVKPAGDGEAPRHTWPFGQPDRCITCHFHQSPKQNVSQRPVPCVHVPPPPHHDRRPLHRETSLPSPRAKGGLQHHDGSPRKLGTPA